VNTYKRKNYNLVGGVWGQDTGLIDTGITLRVKYILVNYNHTGERRRPVSDAAELFGEPHLLDHAEARVVQHPETGEYALFFEGKKYGVFVGTQRKLSCGTTHS